MSRSEAVFSINGKVYKARGADLHTMLADYLRHHLNKPGTKVVCAEGDCGACTVLKYDPVAVSAKAKTSNPSTDKTIKIMRAGLLPINSCIAVVGTLDGSHLITVEGLRSDEQQLSAVQSCMVNNHASQCGYCTPGIVMAMTGLLEKRIDQNDRKSLSEKEVKNSLTGNLCRCTGYDPIIKAGVSLHIDVDQSLRKRYLTKRLTDQVARLTKEPLRYDTEIKTASATTNGQTAFFAPKTLKEAQVLFKKTKNLRILGAATDLGVVHNKGKLRLSKSISLHRITELHNILVSKSGLVQIGSRVTLSELREVTKTAIPEFATFLDIFASPQIKNAATLVGNLVNASPIGDTLPFLLIANTKVVVVGGKGQRTIPIETFFKGYRKTALRPGEIVTHVVFQAPQNLKLYKVSSRKDLDISTVSTAISIQINSKTKKIEEARFAFGGVAATPIRSAPLEKFMKGKFLTSETVRAGLPLLDKTISPLSDLRGSFQFRKLLIKNLYLKYFREYGASK